LRVQQPECISRTSNSPFGRSFTQTRSRGEGPAFRLRMPIPGTSGAHWSLDLPEEDTEQAVVYGFEKIASRGGDVARPVEVHPYPNPVASPLLQRKCLQLWLTWREREVGEFFIPGRVVPRRTEDGVHFRPAHADPDALVVLPCDPLGR